MPRRPLSVVLLWLLSFCFMAALIGSVIDAPDLVLLKHKHAKTSGEVTRLLPDTHGMVEVRYAVAEAVYQRPFAPHLQGHTISEGAKVQVYYSPHDPTIAFMAPPEDILTEQLPSWLAGSLLGSFGITAGVLFLWRKLAPIARTAVGRQ